MLSPKAIKQFFSTKTALVVLSGILIFLVFQFSQVFYQRYSTDKEISDYEGEIKKLEDKQKRLNDALSFLNTDFFAEREARTKLGMQKIGENVVVLPEERLAEPKPEPIKKGRKSEKRGDVPIALADSGQGTDDGHVVKENNPTRWWSYFFGEN